MLLIMVTRHLLLRYRNCIFCFLPYDFSVLRYVGLERGAMVSAVVWCKTYVVRVLIVESIEDRHQVFDFWT